MSNINIVILAAGKGTRMYSAFPKVLHKLAGVSLIQHVVNAAKELNPNKITVVYGHGGETVPQALAGQGIDFALQEPQLGTAHAVKQAKLHPGRTMVLYGDVPLVKSATLKKMIEAEDEMVLLTIELDNPYGYGRVIRDNREGVVRIVEEKDATSSERQIKEVNTGIMLAPSGKLDRWLKELKNDNAQQEYYLTDIISLAAVEGLKIRTMHPEEEWEVMGVNNKTQLAHLERIHQKENARKLMESGVTLIDPARFDLRGKMECATDVSIDANCLFEGKVKLGENVQIGANCVLKDVEIMAGTVVEPFCHLDGAKIGKNCKIGPYARIRPGTAVDDNAHIGNFVEIKNSQIGKNSKANHLSYIGDSTVGKNVNIGAGTITCNYDGANKHRTIIEDDVFIGSDTQLVAPITIGRGVTIGAGSTITRSTPQEGLSLSRSKQIHIEGWKRPVKKAKE